MIQTSHIEALTIEERREGLYLSNVEGVEKVLRSFIEGDVRPGQHWHEADVRQSLTPENASGQALVEVLGIKKQNQNLLEQKVEAFLTSLKESERGEINGDHDVSGTAFFKVTARSEKMKKGYYLHFSAAGGYDLDAEISRRTNKKLMLKYLELQARLSVHDEGQFLFPFEKIVQRLSSLPVTLRAEQSQEEFRGVYNAHASLLGNHYVLDILFRNTPLVVYCEDHINGFLQKGRCPILQVNVTPADLVMEKGFLGPTQRPKRKIGIYRDQDVKKLYAAAEQVKAAILGESQ